MKRVSEHEPLLPPIALVPGDKPFLADEIAAEESGVPLPSMVSDSDAVFSDSASAPLAPELDAPKSELDAPPAADDAVERESAPAGDEIDPAAADESAVPAEPVSDEH